MNTQPQDIFIAISNPGDKDHILSDLVRYSSDIKIKGMAPQGEVFLVSPRSLNQEEVLCKIVGSLHLAGEDEQVIAQFKVAEEKYISQTKVKIEDDFVRLDFSGPLYRVQRREDFRLRLPGSFQGVLRFQHQGVTYSCKLADISAGGCRVEIPKGLDLKVNDSLSAVLSTARRDDLKAEMSVRHLAPHPDREGQMLMGLQFVNQTEIVKNRMAALVMDLYREFFSRK